MKEGDQVSDKSITPIVTDNYASSVTRKYKTHVLPRLEEIYNWLCSGYTDYSICANLGLSRQTWVDYKKTQVELIDAYTRARTERNALVMNSMFKKAAGEKIKIEKVKILNNGDKIEYTEEQYIPPDVNAADLYLRNNSDEYKSAKADTSGLTLIQNNYQLPQLQEQLKQIDEELKKLDAIDMTEVEDDDE